jgi:hypothetical protein
MVVLLVWLNSVCVRVAITPQCGTNVRAAGGQQTLQSSHRSVVGRQ